MAFFFGKKKKAEGITPESLFASFFAPVDPSGVTLTPLYSVRPMTAEDAFTGKTAHLAFTRSNVPIAACVPGSELAGRARAWLTESSLVADDIVWSTLNTDAPFADAFRWLVMEMAAYAIVGADGTVAALVWISDPIRESLKSCAEEEELKRSGKRRKKNAAPAAEVAESAVLEGSATAAAGVTRFTADRARDLPALSSFASQSFKSGERLYSTVPIAFGVCKSGSDVAPAPEYPVWFKGSFEYLPSEGAEPKAFTFLYALSKAAMPLKLGASEATQFLSSLAGGVFSESARRYCALAALKPGRLAFKAMDAAPDLSRAADLAYLDFSLRDSSLTVPGQAIVPTASLVPLARAWRVPFTQVADAKECAAALFDINARMLAKSLPSIIASPELRPRVPRFSVNELLRLLSDHDCRLVIQNVLIPDFGAKRLPEIVFQTMEVAGPNGQTRQAILPYGPLDSRRLDSFLPDAFKQGFYEQTRILQGLTAEACAELNDMALHAIMRASLGGRIDATGRLKYLMKEIVLKADHARAETRLAAFRAQGIPFGLLSALDAKVAQRVAAMVDDRDFALALIDCPDAIAGMRKYISGARTERLREDIEFVKMRIEEGVLSLSDALDAKEKIRVSIERDAERERERDAVASRTAARPTQGASGREAPVPQDSPRQASPRQGTPRR